ncbi:MAG TPA: Uma2 family endonuclease [Bryobacteraceae bacterium]|nr:Uma2 family endonuclease [Bryobacteraceae bacterium]
MAGTAFDALPYEEGRLWELLNGELTPVSSPTLEHQEIVFRLLVALKQYLVNKGGIVSHDVEFALSEDTRLRPDVWLVSAPRSLSLDAAHVPLRGGPDLAVEIISPSEYAAESMRKVQAYLAHGVQEVWQIYPKTREVIAYAAQGELRKFHSGETLRSWLLEDFELPVSSICL